MAALVDRNVVRPMSVSTLLQVVCLCAGMLIVQGVAAQSSNDVAAGVYAQALDQIEAQRYSKALATLRGLQKKYPSFTSIAAVQTRIAVLQESADAGGSLQVFLSALSLRDSGNTDAALTALATIASAYPAGSLTDDALYISAYLQVMDRYDFAAARVALRTLEERFPDSAYSDSAQYLDAIASEQLGDTEAARQALTLLRDRHTALNLPMDFRWPRGGVLSRYWFDRADRRLAIVEARIAGASRLESRQVQADGKLRIAVNVNGTDLQLLLVPSPLTRYTQWLDGGLTTQLPPAIGIYDGVVEGVTDSWVRVVLQQNSITGALDINGTRHKLLPANLIGTLDYYQPLSRKPRDASGNLSTLAESVQGLDALVAPPAQARSMLQSRSRTIETDVRAVPVSIVVDSQFDRYYAGGGLATALNNLNVADGVYRQFGLALSLDEALQLTADADPLKLGAVTLETILRSFRDYRLQYKTLFEDSALTYLFTGNPKTDVTLGLAWIDTACRLDGYDVGVTTPSTFGDVLLTHELGHSLGAQHDTDTQCNDDSLSLMWPNISERTQTEFSRCSKASVLQSRSKACLNNSVNLELSAGSTGTTVSFDVINPDGALTLDARLVVETSSPDQLIWPAGCQEQSPTSALCFLDALEPASVRSVNFPVNAAYHGSDAPVTAQVEPVGVLELQPENNLATASLAGGAVDSHLTISGGGLSPSTPTQDEFVNVPSAASSTSGGAIAPWALALLLLMVRARCLPISLVVRRSC